MSFVNILGFTDSMLIIAINIGQILTPEQGVQIQLWAATVDKSNLQNWACYDPATRSVRSVSIRRLEIGLVSFEMSQIPS